MAARDQDARAAAGRWLVVPRTLAFIFNGHDVLMMRRRNDSRIYPGRYNGVGGHLERDEDPVTGVRREIREETGLEVNQLRLRAIYNIDAGGPQGAMLFVFTARSDSRALPPATSEGGLRWVPRGRLLDLPLVEDLPRMLPRYLDMDDDAAPLHVHVGYDEDGLIHLRIAPDERHGGDEA